MIRVERHEIFRNALGQSLGAQLGATLSDHNDGIPLERDCIMNVLLQVSNRQFWAMLVASFFLGSFVNQSPVAQL